MLCNKCVHKSFCKHYDYMVNAHSLTIDLKECDNYKSKVRQALDDLSTRTMPNNPNSWGGKTSSIINEHVSARDAYTTTASNSDTMLLNKTYPDLKEIIDNQLKPVISDVSVVEVGTAICDRCKNEFKITELENCVECGRPVCTECRVGTLNNGIPEATCEKCWSGTPDPDPNNPEEVKITYGEEDPSKGWDLNSFIDNKEDTVKEEKKDESTGEQVDDKRPTKKSKKK